MSTASPLIAAIQQTFSQGRADRTETYRNVPIRASDPGAYSKLSQQEPPLPVIGDLIAGTDYKVLNVRIQPTQGRPDVSDVIYTLSTTNNAGGVATVAQQGSAEVSFEFYPDPGDVTVPGALLVATNTETIEVGADGLPTNDPPTTINSVGATIERVERTKRATRGRVIYTITGTANEIGISTGFGFGTVPIALQQSNVIHVIDGVALLFKIGSIRKISRVDDAPGEHRYAISYEWRYDSGVYWASAFRPPEWEVNPEVGKSGEYFQVLDTIGVVNADTDGNKVSGVFLPNIKAPLSISTIVGNAEDRYIVPPYCEVELNAKIDNEFPYPSYLPEPQYVGVIANGWQSLPGVF